MEIKESVRLIHVALVHLISPLSFKVFQTPFRKSTQPSHK